MGSNLRVECVDKTGHPFEVREQGAECCDELVRMYDCFTPKAMSQGLPPSDDQDRRRWVQRLIESGWNFVCRQDGEIVGHAAIIPDFDRADGEYIVFVLQPFRNKGLGTALTETAVKKARAHRLAHVWLTVEAFNFRAIKVYRKSGFEFCDEADRERAMVLRLW